MADEFQIRGTEELARLHRQLRQAASEVLPDLHRQVRRAAEPTVTALQGAIRSTPVTGSRGGGGKQRRQHAGDDGRAGRTAGLRETIAGAIYARVRSLGSSVGASIRIDSSQLPPDQRTLPGHIDSGHWRHPVFGSRSSWVDQYGRPWWDTTIRRRMPAMARAMASVADDIARRIT